MYNETMQKICSELGIPVPDSGIVDVPTATRVDLARMYRIIGAKAGAEIGVYRGNYTAVLCTHNRKAMIYAIDPWKVYKGYGDTTSHAKMKDNQRKAESMLEGRSNAKIIYKTSMEALQDFADGSLDFVYIDANHEFPFVAADIYYWQRKVRPGGIVSGHDYLDGHREDGRCHVRQAVHAAVDIFDVNVLFLLGKHPRARDWLWVKQ